ncbi:MULTISPECIES: hypothetical protein [Pseudoalteromonas]|uniref:Uncharacterized protein n=1 Tax=Pseudoalteromonas amylolytica TaxID=1859457 RepID=A0A1S1MNV8_9GAMM|nr:MULTISPECIES: hypothetical protein [Pseudoalteromonas]MCF6437353.1 hypothetical protein [Pseudoalteromonas sp. MMG022]OHU86876.1 hypothetical protein BET10_01380 [Pseudoalteromonas amylolytica]OHU89465.1 hypothetical protein BFC16_04770 [Pseudoalteromonas sp. JW3]
MDFSQLNKQRAASFNKQKQLLKKLSAGQTICCEQCQKPLKLNLAVDAAQKGHVCCDKGCTYIELEIA